MANSPEETQEDREAAETLIKLSQDTDQYQPTEEEEDAAPSSTQLLPQVGKTPQNPCSCKKFKAEEKQHSKNNNKKSKSTKGKRVKLEVDDTNETLMILQEWNQTKPDPMKTIFTDGVNVAKLFSKPIKKQLTMSDIEIGQGRLMLGKQQVQTKMLPLLEASEISQGREGLDVSVYGPNGEVQTMKYKMWGKDTPVLTTGWNDFVRKCKLEKFCDFLTIWMFRHNVTGKICFAIDKNRFDTITGPLSLRISNSVIENPN